jgi:ABC-type nitrate/sulfonate/bicarbonate transport system substrate-binding protein
MRHLPSYVFFCTLAFVLAATSATAQTTNLRLGYGGASEEPALLLIAKPDIGKNHGKAYTLEPIRFSGADKKAQALEANAIDLVISSANGVIFAAAEGVKVKMIASFARESRRSFSTTFYAKANSPVNTIPDMKGKIVGINGFASTGHMWLKAALGKHQLKEEDVRIAPVPFSAMEAALESGKVDVGMFPQPFAAILEKNLKVKKIFSSADAVPFDEELTMLVGKEEILKKNAPAVKALVADLKQAMAYYLERTREARQILIDKKLVRATPDVYLDMQDYYRDPSMRPDVEALERMQAMQMETGFQKNKVDVRKLVDLSYLQD